MLRFVQRCVPKGLKETLLKTSKSKRDFLSSIRPTKSFVSHFRKLFSHDVFCPYQRFKKKLNFICHVFDLVCWMFFENNCYKYNIKRHSKMRIIKNKPDKLIVKKNVVYKKYENRIFRCHNFKYRRSIRHVCIIKPGKWNWFWQTDTFWIILKI